MFPLLLSPFPLLLFTSLGSSSHLCKTHPSLHHIISTSSPQTGSQCQHELFKNHPQRKVERLGTMGAQPAQVEHPEKANRNKAAIQNFQIHTLYQPRMHAALGTREQRSMTKDKTSQYRSNSIADTSEKIGLGNQQSVQANSSIFNNLNLSSSLLTFLKYYYRLCKSQNQLLRYFHFFFLDFLNTLPQHYLDQGS